MKFFARSALCLSIAALAACGGGGSGGSGDAQNLNEDPEVEEPELVLAFDADPLGPDVFNIAAPEESLEQDFNPGEQIRTSWFMTLRYDNDTDLAEGESHLYDATLYLSTDAVIDELDLELFTLECSPRDREPCVRSIC